MPELTLTLDAANLRRLRTLMGVSRLMAAKALTFTAEKAVPAWRAGQAVFHKRNSWIDKGVRMRGARPTNLNAQVGTLDRYMGRHVYGIDDPKRGRLFVPNAPAEQQGTHTKIRRQLRSMGRTKTKPFMRNGVLFRRKGKARAPLIILGRMRREVDIAPRLDALRIVDGVVRREFPRIYERLLLKWSDTGKV